VADGAITSSQSRPYRSAPSTADALCTVHGQTHVLDVLEGRKANGHGNGFLKFRSPACGLSARLSQRLTMLFETGRLPVHCQLPTSGFHHAHYDHCCGFCTFNGLMVAAQGMVSDGRSVAILDCDAHYGDGTQEIIGRLHLADRVSQWAYGRDMPDQFHFAEFKAQIRQFIDDFVAEPTGGQRMLFLSGWCGCSYRRSIGAWRVMWDDR